MAKKLGIDKLVFEARNLRDYITRIEATDGHALTEALLPFEAVETPMQASPHAQLELSRAFQDTFNTATKSIDERTLSDILFGRSPHAPAAFGLPRIAQFCANTSLALIAFLLVMTAFHYSHWATKAAFTVQEAEEFTSFDHFQQMMKVIELKTYFEEVEPGAPTSNLEPQLVYLEELSALEAHYNAEKTLPSDMSTLDDEFNPIINAYHNASFRVCKATANDDTDQANVLRNVLFNCGMQYVPAPIKTGSGAKDESAADPEIPDGATTADVARLAGFNLSLEGFEEEERNTMAAAGRSFDSAYIVSHSVIVSLMHDLRQKLNVVHLWALPIIYGALGSIVFSIWRVLSPNVSSFGLFHSMIRMIFAGLAALTFSMLLVPSNILSVGVDLNRPVIYLLSFIFGYSIEAFVSTLNVLNTYFANNIAARKKQQQ